MNNIYSGKMQLYCQLGSNFFVQVQIITKGFVSCWQHLLGSCSCNHCYKLFSTIRTLKKHKNIEYRIVFLGSCTCKCCYRLFSTVKALKKHKQIEQRAESCDCKQFYQLLSTVNTLKKHKHTEQRGVITNTQFTTPISPPLSLRAFLEIM